MVQSVGIYITPVARYQRHFFVFPFRGTSVTRSRATSGALTMQLPDPTGYDDLSPPQLQSLDRKKEREAKRQKRLTGSGLLAIDLNIRRMGNRQGRGE
jgi:hypothetical protein